MKKLLLLLIFLVPMRGFSQNDTKLWYTKPAKVWTEALPLGNGRLGAMVFGRVENELIQLNESTLWSGGPVKTNVNPNAYANLLLAREALFKEENYTKASALTRKMQGVYSESFEPLGDLMINQDLKGATPTDYYRDLNIRDALATTRFTVNGTVFTRQIFVSAPDQVIVIHLTTSKPGELNFKASTKSVLKFENISISNNEIAMKGRAPAHVDPTNVKYNKEPIIYADSTSCRGMRYKLLVKAAGNGTIVSDTSGISVKNASDVTLYLSAATSFNGFDKCPDSDGKDENKLAEQYLNSALKKNLQTLLNDHLNDYHKYFNRVSFHLAAPENNSNATLPTDERLIGYTNGATDPELENLYFNFGRYLLISCSRTGGTPANLQGIWNNNIRPSWSSNFTTNINTEMNYWPVEMTNLSEMHEPLFDFIKNLSVTGAVTAKEFYHANGWAVHHNSDIWALSNPVGDMRGDPKWANWAMGSPWLCQHLWQHYQFTGDKQFLKNTAYPLMKGAAEFCLSWLVEDKNGYLVTAPSLSPENDFLDDKGQKGNVSIATTMDMSIIWDLFTNLIAASKELNNDSVFRQLITDKRSKLFPLHIGKKGNLQEWYKDWEDVDPHHRHVSHLFALHPGTEISPVTTPDFAAAARKTLELRGDEGTGWSLAWKINFWARLLDGNHAYKLVRDLLRAAAIPQANPDGTLGKVGSGSGTYPNMFDAHPPFQIDGNFGGTAGMTEMLLQSQLNEIHLLPALPDAWQSGEIKGLKARGNFEVAIKWMNNKLLSSSIKSNIGGLCKLRTKVPVKVAGIQAKSVKSNIGYVTSFTSAKGKTYTVTPI
ncbi:glycoside hydrolase family 95 protein [Mucilaginibacter arboris]|uniref:Glycoside hydrolase family 95 protein n=1 Tax=Mucilaginibacter arboris TaxID=2682090 RepID=A0A7K1T168_9SPHI|nr:glycoside hydrolase family 95 protein [Mucilaginibacter arboris]MVN23040.1 glycoside hydrolase family 95 protein [Mucilaginibacter arboris]